MPEKKLGRRILEGVKRSTAAEARRRSGERGVSPLFPDESPKPALDMKLSSRRRIGERVRSTGTSSGTCRGGGC